MTTIDASKFSPAFGPHAELSNLSPGYSFIFNRQDWLSLFSYESIFSQEFNTGSDSLFCLKRERIKLVTVLAHIFLVLYVISGQRSESAPRQL